MKTIIFAGILHLAAAVKMHVYTHQHHALSQIADEMTTSSLAEGATDAATVTDADCEEVVNDIVIRTATPECQLIKKPNSDAALIASVDAIGKQARDI